MFQTSGPLGERQCCLRILILYLKRYSKIASSAFAAAVGVSAQVLPERRLPSLAKETLSYSTITNIGGDSR